MPALLLLHAQAASLPSPSMEDSVTGLAQLEVMSQTQTVLATLATGVFMTAIHVPRMVTVSAVIKQWTSEP